MTQTQQTLDFLRSAAAVTGARDRATAPTAQQYERYRALRKGNDMPTSDELSSEHGSWGAAMLELGFEKVGKYPASEYDTIVADRVESDRLDEISRRSQVRGEGAKTFEIPWRATVYGTTTIQADSLDDAMAAFEELGSDEMLNDYDEIKHHEVFDGEVTETD